MAFGQNIAAVTELAGHNLIVHCTCNYLACYRHLTVLAPTEGDAGQTKINVSINFTVYITPL